MVTFLQNLHRWHWMSGPVRRNGRSKTRYLKIRVPPVGRAIFKLYISFPDIALPVREQNICKKGKSRHGLARSAALTETGERRTLSRITSRQADPKPVPPEHGKHGFLFLLAPCDRRCGIRRGGWKYRVERCNEKKTEPATSSGLTQTKKHGVPFSILCDRPNRHIDRERRERRAEWYDEKRVGSGQKSLRTLDVVPYPQEQPGTGVTA